MIKPAHLTDEATFAHLWVHESQRVFMDRLKTEEDRDFFKGLVTELMN